MNEPPRDRRRLLLWITGGVVAVALIAAVLAIALGGDGGDDEEAEEPTPILTVKLTAPVSASGVIDVNGAAAQLTPDQLTAVTTAIQVYLTEATVKPLSTKPPEEDEETTTTTTAAAVDPLAASFTESAATRLKTDDRFALSDAHLPFAEDGVSFTTATADLAGIVSDGTVQFINATIKTVAMVHTDEQMITVTRTGNLVLRNVDDHWKIAGYDLKVERAIGGQMTTTEAAFG